MSFWTRIRFPPQDFHNCGKHCGKSGADDAASVVTIDFRPVSARRSLRSAILRPSGASFVSYRRQKQGFPEAKVRFAPVFLVIS